MNFSNGATSDVNTSSEWGAGEGVLLVGGKLILVSGKLVLVSGKLVLKKPHIVKLVLKKPHIV